MAVIDYAKFYFLEDSKFENNRVPTAATGKA